MSAGFQMSRPARRDLVEIADYLSRTSLALAERFLDAVDQTCVAAAVMPGKGSPWQSNYPELAGSRFVKVIGFKHHLVFPSKRPGYREHL
jgi:plasmid stabilization system protein ParE